jgi:NAD(P)-dependent dehydrogenase (short-subunit alcohol dehydrogenase family)
VFISGAASGIGLATAQRLAQMGCRVGLYDIQAEEAQAQARLLNDRRPGGENWHVAGHLDVSQPESWQQALQHFADQAQGRIDVLVNNAGVAVTDAFVDTPLARHRRVVEINLLGTMNGCHAVWPHLKGRPGSRVINLCSASALFGQPDLATYAATKAAIRSLTEALDIEWSSDGVRVVDVLPLFVNTAMVRDEVSKMKTVATLGVRLSPQDVAHVVARLATAPAKGLPLHSLVGWQTPLFALAVRLSPTWLNRWVTARMAGKG